MIFPASEVPELGFRWYVELLSRRGCWVNHLADLGDSRSWKSTEFRMPMNDALVFRHIHAEGLLSSYKGFQPLDIRSKLAQGLVGLGRSLPQFFALHCADFRNISFDHEFPHGVSL